MTNKEKKAERIAREQSAVSGQSGKTPLNLPSVPDQMVAAIKHLHAMARRAQGSFEEHVQSEQALQFLLRRFKPVAAPMAPPSKPDPK